MVHSPIGLLGRVFPVKVRAKGDGETNDQAALQALANLTIPQFIAKPASSYRIDTDVNWPDRDGYFQMDPRATFTGAGRINTGQYLIPGTGVSASIRAVRKTWGDDFPSSKYANIYQDSNVAIRTAAGRVVASFAMGIGQAAGAGTWGSNFAGWAADAGATAIACELNPMVTVAGGVAYGLVISVSGNQISGASAINIQGNNNGAWANDGIVFDNTDQIAFSSGSHGIVGGSLFKSQNSACNYFFLVTGLARTAEIDIPQLLIGATPANFNNSGGRLEVVGSTAGNILLKIDGTGSSPATTGNFQIKALSSTGLVRLLKSNNTVALEAGDNGVGFNGAAAVGKQDVGTSALSTGGAVSNADICKRLNLIRTALLTDGIGQAAG